MYKEYQRKYIFLITHFSFSIVSWPAGPNLYCSFICKIKDVVKPKICLDCMVEIKVDCS